VTAPTAAERAQVIAGLRELADLLEAHPELPVTVYPSMQVDAGPVDTGTGDGDEDGKRAVVDQAAAILGRPVRDQHGHYETTWLSTCADPGEEPYARARVQYRVLSITRAAMDAHDARHSYSDNIRVGGAQ
jgi:hypothetical protein